MKVEKVVAVKGYKAPLGYLPDPDKSYVIIRLTDRELNELRMLAEEKNNPNWYQTLSQLQNKIFKKNLDNTKKICNTSIVRIAKRLNR